MENKEILENHERRIKILEDKLNQLIEKPDLISGDNFIFSDKSKKHNELLEELLKSNFCHSKNGISFEEILDIFKTNGRPVVPKKLRDLLAVWKNRKKIEAVKEGGILRYFWIENGN
ncbi:hypothetical protein J4481_02685 [Candidatus Pacearchaeota archaeon]|nr:hypothetical protein [Candidatus Pacearchaeota archaeon]